MTQRIRTTGSKQPLIRDISPKQPRIDPAEVAAALGAEATGIKVEGGHGAMLAVAAQLGKRQATRRLIRLNDEQWQQIEDLAASFASDGFKPTPGQVAAALLSLSLRALADPSADRAALAQELAAIAAAAQPESTAPDNGADAGATAPQDGSTQAKE
jgi:hypothetical protein